MFDMQPYEVYTFIVCMIVYFALTALFTVMILAILRLSLKLIRSGYNDDEIISDYQYAQKNKAKIRARAQLDRIVTSIMCLVLFLVFGFAVYMQFSAEDKVGEMPMYRVVLSNSMADKHEKNKYLVENNLGNQFDRFDLILTHKLPDEKDLQLYDIVVYKVADTLVVHRIVEIEEPNEKHPNERYFRLQGDNVDTQDRFVVKYSQMKAIYKGERIRFVGSFVSFLQSPAGYMCILLVGLGIVFIPRLDKKIKQEERDRLTFLMR